jgi:ABC-type transporter Mla subunit MlaD
MIANQQAIAQRKGLKMIRNLIFSALSALVLTGCIGTSHNFMIQFNDIEGLRKNDQVFFDKTPIGVVTDVEYTDTGNYLVKVAVDDQYSPLPKDSSTFYIDSNPENESQKAVRIIQIQDDGNTIEKNAIVEGQTKYAAIYGQIANKFRKNVRVMESEINEFFKGLQNLSEDEQIKQLERQLDKILSEIENLSAQMKHKLETEILPRIREQIEELRRRLEEIGKEEKLKYVDQKIETISAKL